MMALLRIHQNAFAVFAAGNGDQGTTTLLNGGMEQLTAKTININCRQLLTTLISKSLKRISVVVQTQQLRQPNRKTTPDRRRILQAFRSSIRGIHQQFSDTFGQQVHHNWDFFQPQKLSQDQTMTPINQQNLTTGIQSNFNVFLNRG